MHKPDYDFDPSRAPSVFDIDVLRIARVYADALLQSAAGANKVDDFQAVFDALVGNPFAPAGKDDLATLLGSGALPKDKRGELINKAFEGRADPLFINFLHVLNDHDRLDLIRAVAAAYHEARDKYSKRVRMQVRTAVPLSEQQKTALAAMAREQFRLEPVMVEVIDPDILGGLQVQIGDRLVDLSVRRRLETIKNQMIERSSHEIQRRRDSVGSQV